MDKVIKALRLETPVDRDTPLEEWDSLILLQLISLADHEFGVIIDPDIALKCSTFGQIEDLINAR